jgi:hypothetical protein
VPNRAGWGARRVARRDARRGPDGLPDRVADGGQIGCPTGGQTRWPDGVPYGTRRGQTEWRTEGLFTFKRKNDMFCIRVM